jgi:AcrR family transcriptional regulator
MKVARATASKAQDRRMGGIESLPLRRTCTTYKYDVQRTPYEVQLSTVPPSETETRSPLSREVVADRALALADGEGIETVTIRRLATELGVTPMALYWHFRTKEDLLAGLGDRVLDGLQVPDRSGDWSRDLRAALVAVVTAMRPHPQVAHLVAERIMAHPRGLALTEMGLSALSDAGFGPEPASYLIQQALRAALTMVTGDQVDESGKSAEDRRAHLRMKQAWIASLSPDDYPTLVAHAEAMTYCSDVDRFYDLGVDHYLAGVQGLAPRPPAGGGGTTTG